MDIQQNAIANENAIYFGERLVYIQLKYLPPTYRSSTSSANERSKSVISVVCLFRNWQKVRTYNYMYILFERLEFSQSLQIDDVVALKKPCKEHERSKDSPVRCQQGVKGRDSLVEVNFVEVARQRRF